jgi:hypothetical protein
MANNSGAWHVLGWIDKTSYLDRIESRHWQLRYQDESLLIVRIPPAVGQDLSWQLLEKIERCTTNDWWLSATKSTLALKAALGERFGTEFVSVVIDNRPPGD